MQRLCGDDGPTGRLSKCSLRWLHGRRALLSLTFIDLHSLLLMEVKALVRHGLRTGNGACTGAQRMCRGQEHPATQQHRGALPLAPSQGHGCARRTPSPSHLPLPLHPSAHVPPALPTPPPCPALGPSVPWLLPLPPGLPDCRGAAQGQPRGGQGPVQQVPLRHLLQAHAGHRAHPRGAHQPLQHLPPARKAPSSSTQFLPYIVHISPTWPRSPCAHTRPQCRLPCILDGAPFTPCAYLLPCHSWPPDPGAAAAGPRGQPAGRLRGGGHARALGRAAGPGRVPAGRGEIFTTTFGHTRAWCIQGCCRFYLHVL